LLDPPLHTILSHLPRLTLTHGNHAAYHVVRPPVKDVHGHGDISVVEAQGHSLLERRQGIHHHAAALFIRVAYRLQHLQWKTEYEYNASEGREIQRCGERQTVAEETHSNSTATIPAMAWYGKAAGQTWHAER